MSSLLAGLLLLAITSCGGDPTQLLVWFDTDYAVPSDTNRIAVRVMRVAEGVEEERWRDVFALDDDAVAGELAIVLPASFTVVAENAEDSVVVELAALRQGDEVPLVMRRARTGFIKGKTLSLPIFLHRFCADVQCQSGQSCGCEIGSSCDEPTCVDEFIDPNDLMVVDDPNRPPGNLHPDAGVDPDASVTSDAGERPDGGDQPDGGMVTACSAPETLCQTRCVNTSNDPRYCGSCTHACPPGDVCRESSCWDPGDCRTNGSGCSGFTYCEETSGDCLPGCEIDAQCSGDNERCDASAHACACDNGYHECPSGCSANDSVNTCGNRCSPCPTPAHGSATCVLGSCGIVCDENYAECGGSCVNTDDDARHCGRCDKSCKDDEICTAGECMATVQTGSQIVASEGDVGDLPALAVGTDGRPHILYIDDTTPTGLYYARMTDEGSWDTRELRPGGSTTFQAAITPGTNGRVHVAQAARFELDLYHIAIEADGTATEEFLFNVTRSAREMAIAVGPNGRPQITFYDGFNIWHTRKLANGTWPLELVGVGDAPSLAVDENNRAHIVYYDFQTDDLMYWVRETNGSWTGVPIDTDGNTGHEPDIALDGQGRAHISYRVSSSNVGGSFRDDLRYAIYSPDGSIEIQTVAEAGNVGYNSSLALTSSGQAYIVYEGDDLILAQGNPDVGNWSFRTVHPNPGRSSMQLGPQGFVHIAHYQPFPTDLLYTVMAP